MNDLCGLKKEAGDVNLRGIIFRKHSRNIFKNNIIGRFFFKPLI